VTLRVPPVVGESGCILGRYVLIQTTLTRWSVLMPVVRGWYAEQNTAAANDHRDMRLV